MSSDRLTRRIACLGLLGLAGCGFTPIYQNNAAIRGLFSFDTDASVIGFHVGSRLAGRFGEPVAPRYVIKVTVETSQRSATITAEGESARFNLIGVANWSVIASGTGEQVLTGRTEAFTSYAATSSTVATQATADDAGKRLAIILADMITTRVLASAEDLV